MAKIIYYIVWYNYTPLNLINNINNKHFYQLNTNIHTNLNIDKNVTIET